MTLADSRLYILLLAYLLSSAGVGSVHAAPPKLQGTDVDNFVSASSHLRQQLASVTSADEKTLRAMEDNLATVRRGLSLYFHAPNLRDKNTRPLVLRMRRAIEALRAVPALLVLHRDVFRFAAPLHQELAARYRALGQRDRAQAHERLAQVTKGPPARSAPAHGAPAAGSPSPKTAPERSR